ncbi:MAG: hypothetical protein ACK5PB_18990 [Pirellula sp.]|jgi:hypothetical protein
MEIKPESLTENFLLMKELGMAICLPSKVSENGIYQSTEIRFCRLQKQTISKVVLSKLEAKLEMLTSQARAEIRPGWTYCFGHAWRLLSQ